VLASRLASVWKALRTKATPQSAARAPAIFARPYAPAAGWWRDDPAEQLRNYQSWVYAAVNAIGQEAARQRPAAYRSTGQAEHDQIPLPHTHPLCRLLDAPNPWLTAWELWYLTVVYLELTGNCFWYVAPTEAGTPAELWVIPTPWVKVLPDPVAYVRGYEVAAPGGTVETFSPREIVHLKYPNPLDPHRGLSPLQAVALTVDANLELIRARHQTFRAGPRPGIVLHTEQALSTQTLSRLEDKLKEKFSGRDAWYRPMVLEQGLSATPWTLTPAEMDFLNSSKLTRD